MTQSENNKRIAKNTIFLYFRMFLIMGVSLYTSRIVLNTLGIDDFGIYNVVAGVVVLFSFLNMAMSSATQRFLNFEMGIGTTEGVRRVFSMSMTAHFTIVILVIVLSESIGLWILNTQLNIPNDRMNAANWVYQFSILAICIQIIRVPYNASILAYEKMSFYAYISIAETVLKLFIVYLLFFFGGDKLKLYAILTCGVTFLVLVLYKLYCNRVFITCRYIFFWDKALYKKLMSFSGWSLFGSTANVGAQQGLNILLNVFFGVSVNATMGIANQVNSAMAGFIANFQTAYNPQIVKSYASNDRTYFMRLIFQASKFSYYLFLLIALPVILNIDFILLIWLKNVPEFTASFCRLIILFLFIDALSAPLWMSIQAKGEIRNYNILMGFLVFLNLPLAYIFLKFGFQPASVLFIRLIINFITFLARIIYLKPQIGLPIRRYFREVILQVTLVTVLTLPLPLMVFYYSSSWLGLITTTITSLLSTLFCIYSWGLEKNEREFIKSIISKRIPKPFLK